MRSCSLSFCTWLFATSFGLPLAAQGPPAALVETATVEEHEFHDQLTLVGRTAAWAESRVVAEVSGRVSSVDAGEGQRLRRGATLVRLDCRRLVLSLEAKQAESEQARAAAELAAKELARARELVETSVFPQRNLDAAEAEALRSAERHRELDAERRRLELDRDSCTITAPYDGYTVRKLVDVGEWVDAGTAVFEMVDLSVVKVMVDLPEKRFGELRLGSPVTVDVHGGEPLTGRVKGIAPDASEATHTFPVIVAVDNPDGRLGGGMLVRATLRLNATFRSLAVSKDAIVRQGEQTVVYTVADGVANLVPVRVRASNGNDVAIEPAGGELAVGAPVVVRGNERIFPGSPVRLVGEAGDEDGP